MCARPIGASCQDWERAGKEALGAREYVLQRRLTAGKWPAEVFVLSAPCSLSLFRRSRMSTLDRPTLYSNFTTKLTERVRSERSYIPPIIDPPPFVWQTVADEREGGADLEKAPLLVAKQPACTRAAGRV